MKLIVAVVNHRDKNRLCDALTQNDFRFTHVGSTGGFLREGNTTLIIGVEPEQVETVVAILRDICQTRERIVSAAPPGADVETPAAPLRIQIGGAKVFVLEVEQFIEV